MLTVTIADVFGLVGAALIVVAYLMLQVGRMDARSVSYSALNGAGAAAILVSLYYDFNLGAFVIEAFWLAISLYGLLRAFAARLAKPNRVADSE